MIRFLILHTVLNASTHPRYLYSFNFKYSIVPDTPTYATQIPNVARFPPNSNTTFFAIFFVILSFMDSQESIKLRITFIKET